MPVTREDVRRRVAEACRFARKYGHWIGDENRLLIEAVKQLVDEENEAADALAMILEQKK